MQVAGTIDFILSYHHYDILNEGLTEKLKGRVLNRASFRKV
jgi:hypothetical protein